MSSLTNCLRKAGDALRPEDRSAIMSMVSKYKAEGLDQQAAAVRAVETQLASVRALMQPGAEAAPEPIEKPTGNTIFTDEMAAKARAVLKRKLGALNSGMDPEIMAAGLTLAGHYIESGVRTFSAFSKAMIGDIGEAVRPYLKSFYMAARYDPRAAKFEGMSSAAEVDAANMATIDKQDDRTYESVKAEYESNFKSMMTYGPDKVGASTFSDKMAALADKYPEYIARIDAEAEAKPAKAPAANAPMSLADHFFDKISTGLMPKDNPALRKMVSEFDGAPADDARLKQAQESLEAAIVRTARDIVASNRKEGPKTTFAILQRLYASQPNLSTRTSTSIAQQAYSTPAPLAFLASELAGIKKGESVLEPTGGTGMLLIGATIAKADVNELNGDRAQLLRDQGFRVSEKDATELTRNAGYPVDRVITNPPFGPIKNADGDSIKVSVDGYKIGQIDHLIAARALATMKDDGGAALILGANMVAGGQSANDTIFFNWLYSKYNVTSHFEVNGDLYSRQGASWPVRVITIQGRQASDRIAPPAGSIERAMTWDEVYERYQKGLEAAGSAATDGGSAVRSATPAGRSNVPVGVPVAAAGQDPASDSRGRELGQSGNANVVGVSPGNVGDRVVVPEQRVGGSDRELGRDEPAPEKPQSGGRVDGSARSADNATGNPRTALAPAESQYQTAYIERSARKGDGALIPVNMAGPTQAALDSLENRVGNIDDFVQSKLGYASRADLHRAFMGLQVDSIAAAIDQIEQGKGIIIADQTGIGKGRQAAGVIRWAARSGYTPVFLTVKASLFTDMHGDLQNIGSDDIAPLIFNAGEWVSGVGDERLFENKGRQLPVLQKITQSGRLPEGRNAAFLTYSQINVDNEQRRALLALAATGNMVLVADESHNAAGDSATGDFIKEVLALAKGATYLSATYAKRPDNMPVYFKTDIGQAVADDDTLMAAMTAGGLPLQTVVANNLVQAGQMFRRERSFAGIEILTKVDVSNTDEHTQISDKATTALRSIVSADRAFHELYFKDLEKKLKAEQKGDIAMEGAGNQAKASVDHSEFSSVVHNFIKQLLFGIKAETAARDAIASIKAGKKPIIAFENTMGSFLSEYVKDNAISAGGFMGTFDYRTVLTRALARSRAIKMRNKMGNETIKQVSMQELSDTSPISYEAYIEAQKVIDALSVPEIPVSPVDWIRHLITSAGHNVAEITGRNLAVDYSDPKAPKLSSVPTQEQNDKVETSRRFNGMSENGTLDALLVNVAGSTGISLHASEAFKDQRPRHMIVAQAAGDINTFMQMLGRINRTGQVVLPSYSLLSVNLPAEKRPTAVLSGKMKSLNANTSSNTDSATSIKALDMLNKYGDLIVAHHLIDNMAMAKLLNVDDKLAINSEGNSTEDLARTVTGRVALLPVKDQQLFYDEIEGQYEAHINYLNETNQNDLEPRTFDYEARETMSARMFEGQNPATPFGTDANYGEYSVKAQGKAMTPAEIREEMAAHLGGQLGSKHALDMSAKLQLNYATYFVGLTSDKEKESAQTAHNIGYEFLRNHPIGSMFTVDVNGDVFNAIVTNIKNSHKASGNPFSMSKFQVTIAVNGALRSLTVPASQFSRIETRTIAQNDRQIDTLFKPAPTNEREQAKIVTGNLLGAFGELANTGTRGRIITFSKADGTAEQGILLPKSFNFAKDVAQDYRVRTAADVVKYLNTSQHENIDRFGVMTRDNALRVLPADGGVQIKVSKTKKAGGRFFLDKKLLEITGDFTSGGSHMSVSVRSPAAAVRAVQVLLDKVALYTTPSMQDDARQVLDDPKSEPKTINKGSEAGNPDVAREAGVVPATLPGVRTGPGAADWLAKNGSQAWVRELAGKLAPNLTETTIQYVQAGTRAELPAEVRQAFSEGAFGTAEYNPNTGATEIYMRYDAQNPVREDSLLHELIHGATERGLNAPGNVATRAELDSIRGTLQAQLQGLRNAASASTDARAAAEFYLSTMDSNSELLAYGLSSPTFREWAESMDTTGRFAVTKGAPTLWQRFVDAVRSLIGMSRMYTPRVDALLRQDGHATRTTATPQNLSQKLDELLRKTMDSGAWADAAPGVNRMNRGMDQLLAGVRGMDQEKARNLFSDAITSHGKVGFWAKTVGTQYAKAEDNPTTFKPVFNHIQDYIKDTSTFAMAASDRAPGILPRLDSWVDVKRKSTPAPDLAAAGNAAFQGTLTYTRDDTGRLVQVDNAIARAETLTSEQKASELFRTGKITEAKLKTWQASPLDIYDGAVRNLFEREFLTGGVVFKDAELRSQFNMTDGQISLYREFRASVDQSLDDLGRVEIIDLAGKNADPVRSAMMAAATMADASSMLLDHLTNLQDESTAAEDKAGASAMFDLFNRATEKVSQIQRLKEKGYAPLMRFGKNTVLVESGGATKFFGMYETQTEANRVARELRNDPELQGNTFTQGTMSEEQFKLFQGMPLDALEVFAETVGEQNNPLYQKYLAVAKSNRSVMKRLINRKGIAGFNDDMARVLATFVTSNARHAAGLINLKLAAKAANDIPKAQGELKDEAVKLIEYVQSSQSEGGAVRALMFTQFIGGSVASAAINLTQPFTMTLPYLTQFGGAIKAGQHLLGAVRAVAFNSLPPNIKAAMKLAEDNGIVSPQEIHHLQAESASNLGRNPYIKKAAFIWGSMFSLAEQFNRRTTFVAAYNTALEHGMADPQDFAEKTVIETQGLYNKGNKPNLARGAIGGTVMTFKQFSIHYLEFLRRMSKNGPEGRKAVGVALALLMLTAGAGGLPFAGDLEDLIDTLAQALGYDFSTKRARKAFIADTLGLGEGTAEVFDRGISGLAGMPLDVSMRMGMGNLLPMTGILLRSNTDRSRDVLELAGAAGSLAKSALDAGGLALQGRFAEAGMKLAPMAIQNMAKGMQMYETGEYRNEAGKKVAEVDGVDAVLKGIGFQPGNVATQSALLGDVTRSKQLAENVKRQIVTTWAQGLNDNDPAKISEARSMLADWNEKNEANMRMPMQSVINLVRQMRETPQQRLIRSAPPDIRAEIRGRLQ